MHEGVDETLALRGADEPGDDRGDGFGLVLPMGIAEPALRKKREGPPGACGGVADDARDMQRGRKAAVLLPDREQWREIAAGLSDHAQGVFGGAVVEQDFVRLGPLEQGRRRGQHAAPIGEQEPVDGRETDAALHRRGPREPLAPELDWLVDGCDVVVDFTNAVWTPALAEVAMARGVRLVIGTTGLSSAFVERLATDCAERKVGGLVASNFALSAVLMMEFAKQAARLFDHAEIIELHHNQKVDAPSGTAKTTAEMMLLARGRDFEHADTERFTVDGARGGDLGGIAIHSVRLPGLVAHQEVIFGSLGQTLTIRQDSTGRDSFMPGVLLAVRKVMHLDRLVVGLDGILGLDRE